MRTTPILLAVAAVFLNCATLNPVSANVCGNDVVEANEDCDGAKNCGAPTADAAHACHFICNFDTDPATAIACAPGSSCGADGVCRTPAGSFASALAGVSTNVSVLLAGDFDGDRHTDLIGSPPYGSAGASRVHFFDTNSALATATELDLPIPLATVKDLDGDHLDDLGFAIRTLGFGAFGALKGQSDRTFATVLYPALTLHSTDARWTVVSEGTGVNLPGAVTSCAFGIVNGGGANRVTSVCDGATGPAGEYNQPITQFSPTSLIADPQAGVLYDAKILTGGLPEGCGQLVFATSAQVYILSPCVPGGGAWSPVEAMLAPSFVTLKQAAPTITGLFVGPVRRADSDDILALTSDGMFVYDKAAGNFVSTTISLPNVDPSTLPLASGDLNADNIVDFVYPTGIQLSKALAAAGAGAGAGIGTGDDDDVDAGTARIAPRDNLTWAYAQIGRFNDDELPDVLVSFADNQLDVDVLGNAGDGRFTPFTVRSDQFVRRIGAGDFDGDRIDDVAFLQTTDPDPSSDGAADLYIAFGSATGAPEAAHLVGKLKSAHSLLSLRDSAIGVDDLSVISTSPEIAGNPQGYTGNQSAITILFGSGSRTQVAPLFMIDPTDNAGSKLPGQVDSTAAAHYWQPVSFSIGPFVTPGPNQIVSLATGFTVNPKATTLADLYKADATQAWFAGYDDNAVGDLDPFVQSTKLTALVGLDNDALATGEFELAMITASGDIDYPVAAGQEVDELVTITQAAADKTALAIYVVRPGPVTTPVLSTRIANASVLGSDPIQIVDIDGDHDPDVVFIVTVGGKRQLMIMRGDGKGDFAAPAAVAVPDDALTFAPINTGKAHLELAVVTPTKLNLASLDGVTDISPAVDSPAYTGVAVGDFNGDGIQDIALANSGSIQIMPQNHVVH